ncbi:conserved hypothetical protein, partial [Ricinus communis]
QCAVEIPAPTGGAIKSGRGLVAGFQDAFVQFRLRIAIQLDDGRRAGAVAGNLDADGGQLAFQVEGHARVREAHVRCARRICQHLEIRFFRRALQQQAGERRLGAHDLGPWGIQQAVRDAVDARFERLAVARVGAGPVREPVHAGGIAQDQVEAVVGVGAGRDAREVGRRIFLSLEEVGDEGTARGGVRAPVAGGADIREGGEFRTVRTRLRHAHPAAAAAQVAARDDVGRVRPRAGRGGGTIVVFVAVGAGDQRQAGDHAPGKNDQAHVGRSMKISTRRGPSMRPSRPALRAAASSRAGKASSTPG